jgi:hypothetical protein
MDKIIYKYEDFLGNSKLLTPIDWQTVEQKLNIEIEKSKNWLNNAIKYALNLKKSYSDYDVFTQLSKFHTICENSLYVGKFISFITDFQIYIQKLNDIKDDCIIIMAIRDTIWAQPRRDLAELLIQLGLFSDLTDKYWHSYIAVMDAGEVLFETTPLYDKDQICKILVNGLTVDCVSGPFQKSDTAHIYINGADYSENLRGINIVVIDKYTNLVIDSVAFDTFQPKPECYRKGRYIVGDSSGETAIEKLQKGLEILQNQNEKLQYELSKCKRYSLLWRGFSSLRTHGFKYTLGMVKAWFWKTAGR